MKRCSYDINKETEYVIGGSFVVGHKMHFQSFGTVSEQLEDQFTEVDQSSQASQMSAMVTNRSRKSKMNKTPMSNTKSATTPVTRKNKNDTSFITQGLKKEQDEDI